MNFFSLFFFLAAGMAFLVVALVKVIRDLLERSPHETPLIQDDGLSWPRRYQGATRGADDFVRRASVPQTTPRHPLTHR